MILAGFARSMAITTLALTHAAAWERNPVQKALRACRCGCGAVQGCVSSAASSFPVATLGSAVRVDVGSVDREGVEARRMAVLQQQPARRAIALLQCARHRRRNPWFNVGSR